MNFTFGSVCSGIEAASQAFGPLGWKAAWFSEIDAFASAVLKHHYPHVPNLGDMTTIAAGVLAGTVEAPDVLCGGTPCQSFSVAGLRESLADERGNLSLEFIRIANAIDAVRRAAGKPPARILWENVPGVLSTGDNAFGAFLGGLCGSDTALVSGDPDGRWPSAGVVDGPQRTVAWRTLDAQFFGVAQRRKRVFVLALGGAGRWQCADALLPVSDSLSWHPEPRREPRQGPAAGTLRSTDGGSDVDHARAGHLTTEQVQCFGGNRTSGPIEVAPALLAQPGSGWKGDFESETFVAFQGRGSNLEVDQQIAGTLTSNIDRASGGAPCVAQTLTGGGRRDGGYSLDDVQLVAHTLRGSGHDASEDGSGRGTPLVATAIRTNQQGANGHGVSPELAHTLDSTVGNGQAVVFDTTQITSVGNRSNPQPGDPCHTLAKDQHAPLAVTFNWQGDGKQTTLGYDESSQVAGTLHVGQTPAVLQAESSVAYTTKLHNTASNNAGKLFEERSPCLDASSPPPALLTARAVRRLMPVECERLQGMRDGYTKIPGWNGWRAMDKSETPEQCQAEGLEVRKNPKTGRWRVKDVDGPRYKAIGNSWAVPCVRWIGQRIEAVAAGEALS